MRDEIERLRRRLEKAQRPFESGDDEFREAMNALEARLSEVCHWVPPDEDKLEALIEASSLAPDLKKGLHRLRRVRNTLAHNTDVHVGKAYTRSALDRLRHVAVELDGERLTAATVMVESVTTVLDSDSIAHARDLMLQGTFSQLPVLDANGRVVGAITERSILEFLADGWNVADLAELPVREALSPDVPPELRAETSLADLVQKLKDPRVQLLLVVQDGQVRGIVTRADVMRYAF
jgi:predicted transcriptional regulator